MKVIISNPIKITLVKEVSKSYPSLTISRIVDMVQQKKVIVFTQEIESPITIWEGDSYDSIGDWTKEMISEVLQKTYGGGR